MTLQGSVRVDIYEQQVSVTVDEASISVYIYQNGADLSGGDSANVLTAITSANAVTEISAGSTFPVVVSSVLKKITWANLWANMRDALAAVVRWLPLSALSQSSATDGQVPSWDEDSQSWVPASVSGVGETDPVVGAVDGLVKADGEGTISKAVADTDYQSVPSEGAFEDGDKTALDANTSARHTQGTDQALDTGGASEVSAAQAKAGYTHSQGDGSDHSDVIANNAKISYDGDVSKLDIDGADDIGEDLADDDLLIVNAKKSALSRLWTYISGKIAAVTDVSSYSWVLDQDDMSGDSNTKVPTQQSVKAYVDNNAGNASSGASGSVQVSDGNDGFTSDETLLFWDTVNKRLGINTDTPSYALDLIGQLQLRNANDLTRYLQFAVSSYTWSITAQSDLHIESGGILRLRANNYGSLGELWDVGGLYFRKGTELVRDDFPQAGLSTRDSYIASSDGYDASGRRNANVILWKTGNGASSASANAGDGGEIIFDFGRGGEGTGFDDGTSGKLVLRISDDDANGTEGPVLEVQGALTQTPLTSDPPDPDDGNSVQWISDGTGSGDAGDVMIKINVGGTVKTITLVDYSAA